MSFEGFILKCFEWSLSSSKSILFQWIVKHVKCQLNKTILRYQRRMTQPMLNEYFFQTEASKSLALGTIFIWLLIILTSWQIDHRTMSREQNLYRFLKIKTHFDSTQMLQIWELTYSCPQQTHVVWHMNVEKQEKEVTDG